MGDKKYIFIALAVLLVAAPAGWLITRYYQSPAAQFRQPLIELKDDTGKVSESSGAQSEDNVAVKMFYPSDDGLSEEERKVQNNQLPVKMAESVVAEYLKGLKEGLRNTRLLGIYRDKRNILYIDLSDEFRRNFSGDVRQEYFLLKSLFETVVTNISGTEDVKLLIEGKEVESIGGHFNVLYPLGDTVKSEVQQSAARSR
ncbi:MAG: GerMN domain-containing protein [Nitrospirae bacterium]|nr:GerMN domain-containing protein [Nitrospirota bacterium]